MKNAFSTILSSSLLAATVAIGSSLMASPARSLELGFDNISNNSAVNAAAGESQLFVDVLDASGGENLNSTQALFKFRNDGPAASSITQIYFDNSTALGSIASISNSSGVDFSVASGNLNLPAGNNVNFNEDFGVKANSPVQPKGVNPGEWVSVLFNLNAGQTLQNVFADIASGDLRVGFHVQGFADGGSEAFVNNPPGGGGGGNNASVPEPTTMAGLGLIAASLGVSRRKSHKNA